MKKKWWRKKKRKVLLNDILLQNESLIGAAELFAVDKGGQKWWRDCQLEWASDWSKWVKVLRSGYCKDLLHRDRLIHHLSLSSPVPILIEPFRPSSICSFPSHSSSTPIKLPSSVSPSFVSSGIISKEEKIAPSKKIRNQTELAQSCIFSTAIRLAELA